jgi:hypothetical protein
LIFSIYIYIYIYRLALQKEERSNLEIILELEDFEELLHENKTEEIVTATVADNVQLQPSKALLTTAATNNAPARSLAELAYVEEEERESEDKDQHRLPSKSKLSADPLHDDDHHSQQQQQIIDDTEVDDTSTLRVGDMIKYNHTVSIALF